ncbi:MAG: hypothetical protein R6W73_07755 [Candidatus Saliniplasma sp.]
MGPYDRKDGSRSNKPLIAGLLMIIAFILAVVAAGQIFLFDLDAVDIEEELEGEEVGQELIETVMNVCGAVFLILGIFLLVGGILAIKRMYWGVALAASIAGIFSMGPFFLGSVLSLIALVLIVMSKDEFKGKGNDGQWMQEQSEKPPTQFNQKESFCPDCGSPMRYDEGYERWYCETCQEYK